MKNIYQANEKDSNHKLMATKLQKKIENEKKRKSEEL